MLSGKTAVVTGASRGIGRAIAEKLAAEGAFVVINYNGSKEAAETVLAGIRAAGGDGCVMQCNVSDFAACEAWMKEILALYGKIDILVNKRGVPVTALLATTVIAALCFLTNIFSPEVVYIWLLNLSGMCGFVAWLGIAISHYRFRRAYLAQGKSLQDLVYRAKWFPFGPLLALALCILVIIGQDTQWLLHGQFDWQRMVITYMGLPVFVGFYVYHKRRHRTRKIPLDQVNLSQDVD